MLAECLELDTERCRPYLSVEDQCCEAGMKKTLAVATLALLFF